MRFIKYIKSDVICIIVICIVMTIIIFSSFPACSISGERTFGSGVSVKCCGDVSPPPECNSVPGRHCEHVRDKCLIGGCTTGICAPCAGSDGCHPCLAYADSCLNQSTEECVGE
jgi:hypothetical protein